jgi:hypothetical protein
MNDAGGWCLRVKKAHVDERLAVVAKSNSYFFSHLHRIAHLASGRK